MKKVILSMLMLLIVALAFANNRIDSIKAIIAVEFQKVSLKSDNVSLQKLDKSFANVDSVAKVVSQNLPNVQLCDDIKKLDVKLSDDTICITGLINEIKKTEYKKIVAFFNKDPKREDEITKILKTKLSEYNSKVRSEAQLSTKIEAVTRKPISKKQAMSGETTSWRIISIVVISISCLIIGGFLFYIYKNKKYIETKFKDLEVKYRSEIYKKKSEISELETENKNLRGKVKKLESDIVNYKDAEVYLEGEIVRLKNKLSDITSNEEQQEKSNVVSLPQNKTILYLGLAHDGVFVDVYEQYKSGKVLFQLSTYDNEIGEFEFVVKPETLSMVNNSITGTIETACILENDDINIINSIETITKGKVKKESNEWIIKEKAVVRLS